MEENDIYFPPRAANFTLTIDNDVTSNHCAENLNEPNNRTHNCLNLRGE